MVIGAPMYNFGAPSTLQAWFDYVPQPGITFRYTSARPEGLFSVGPDKATGAQEPHADNAGFHGRGGAEGSDRLRPKPARPGRICNHGGGVTFFARKDRRLRWD